MGMQIIEQPFDEYEKQLLSQIDEINRRAQLEIQPLLSLLAEALSLKPVKYIITAD